jgi:ribonuclease III
MNLRAEAVANLERRLGHSFSDRSLLERALTHSSVGHGARAVEDNERLEFLGDRVLGLIVANDLFRRFPEAPEGELSSRLHALVSRDVCALVAERLGVPEALRLAPGETKSGGRYKKTILGDACEALIGAVFLDAGFEAAHAIFGPLWAEEIERLAPLTVLNPKSRLQEWAAGAGRTPPIYAVVGREGPDHAPRFTVRVALAGFEPAQGEGGSRQDAEKATARALLEREGLL